MRRCELFVVVVLISVDYWVFVVFRVCRQRAFTKKALKF